MFCVECGAKGEPGKFCVECGAKLGLTTQGNNRVKEIQIQEDSSSAPKSTTHWAIVLAILISIILIFIATLVWQGASDDQITRQQSTMTPTPTPKTATKSPASTAPSQLQLQDACSELKKPVELLAIPMTYEEADRGWPKIWVALGLIEDGWVHNGIPISQLRSALQGTMDEPDSSSKAAQLLEAMIDVSMVCQSNGVDIDIKNQTWERQGY